MNDEELLAWSRQGFIPGEKESEADFMQRVQFGLELHHHLEKHLKKPLPPTAILQQSLPVAEALYGIRPAWVPVLFSNEKMLPWHGGAALIFQLEENAPLAAMIQLRPTVYHVLGSTQERIVHELSHIGRMCFEEKKYEEIIAYRSSPNPLRKMFGPLFQSGKESVVLAALLLLALVFDLVLLLANETAWYDHFFWLKALPLAFLLYLLVRLGVRQTVFKRLLEKLPLSLVYRLTDQEIERFAKSTPQEIATYLEQNQNQSLRHRLLYQLHKQLI